MTLKISNYNKEELKEALTETQIVGHSIWHEQDLDEKELKKLVPANRFGEAQEVADLVSFLVSKKSSYITGEVVNINGGIYS